MERMKNTSAWVGGRSIQGKARKDEEKKERDNIVETRFETTEEYGPLQPLPPYPAAASVSASLDAAWVSASEEKGSQQVCGETKARDANGRRVGRP